MRGFLALAILLGVAALPVTADPLQPASRTPVRTDCSCGAGRPAPDFEPSGIALDGSGTLYAVSDSGQIVRRAAGAADGAPWSCLYVWCGEAKEDRRGKADNDFESVAFVPGADFSRFLWVGVEGTELAAGEGTIRVPPQIRKFDLIDRRFVGGYSLGAIPFEKGRGVESMTFVPAPGPSLGGYFIAASQAGDGRVYVFDLDAPPREDPATGAAAVPPRGQPLTLPGSPGVSSDFYFAPASCALYVAYDDESDAVALDRDGRARLTTGRQAAAVYAFRGLASPQPFELKQVFELPATRGVEGVAVLGSASDQTEMVVAIDLSGGQNPGELAAGDAGRIFAKKKDLKAAKGRPQPNTIDRYRVARPNFCPPRP